MTATAPVSHATIAVAPLRMRVPVALVAALLFAAGLGVGLSVRGRPAPTPPPEHRPSPTPTPSPAGPAASAKPSPTRMPWLRKGDEELSRRAIDLVGDFGVELPPAPSFRPPKPLPPLPPDTILRPFRGDVESHPWPVIAAEQRLIERYPELAQAFTSPTRKLLALRIAARKAAPPSPDQAEIVLQLADRLALWTLRDAAEGREVAATETGDDWVDGLALHTAHLMGGREAEVHRGIHEIRARYDPPEGERHALRFLMALARMLRLDNPHQVNDDKAEQGWAETRAFLATLDRDDPWYHGAALIHAEQCHRLGRPAPQGLDAVISHEPIAHAQRLVAPVFHALLRATRTRLHLIAR